MSRDERRGDREDSRRRDERRRDDKRDNRRRDDGRRDDRDDRERRGPTRDRERTEDRHSRREQDEEGSTWKEREPKYGGRQEKHEGHMWSQRERGDKPAWAPRPEQKEIVLIGDGRENVQSEGAPMPQQYAVAPNASVVAMEAVAKDLAKPKELKAPDEEEKPPESEEEDEESDEEEVDHRNFKTTGKLAEDTNMVNGVVVKYSEPPEARMPAKRWRLYVFKGDEKHEPYHLHRFSHYLIGRERKVCTIILENPSISSQHAVLQYRQVDSKNKVGKPIKVVKPYLIDLDSVNGTMLNGSKIEGRRYHELRNGDAMQFGQSARQFVLLHEDSTKKMS